MWVMLNEEWSRNSRTRGDQLWQQSSGLNCYLSTRTVYGGHKKSASFVVAVVQLQKNMPGSGNILPRRVCWLFGHFLAFRLAVTDQIQWSIKADRSF